MEKRLHWTEGSIEDFRYRVAYDFVNQVEFMMQDQNLRQADLAAKLNVTPGRVSQFFNNPGNMGLNSMVGWARMLGRKVAVVLYDDDDPRNANGPVHSEVFRLCWERMGKPIEVCEIEEQNAAAGGSGPSAQVRPSVDAAEQRPRRFVNDQSSDCCGVRDSLPNPHDR